MVTIQSECNMNAEILPGLMKCSSNIMNEDSLEIKLLITFSNVVSYYYIKLKRLRLPGSKKTADKSVAVLMEC